MNLKYKVIVLIPNVPYYDYGWSQTEEGADELYRQAVNDFKDEGYDVRKCIYDKELDKWILMKR